ncbi:hypothetical protein [Brevundimonas sp. SL130]|uniref:hypothetical protein n=1 Tax=Brevundimonas sp. SL130 TaxID=2995143 RepID=UPI00226CDA1F|nr:hypothetical protein [Brevundimonas sp. SL130]WAC59926.1 hypothetical protein OU998_00340 [Brevundimonas sp. SL130]
MRLFRNPWLQAVLLGAGLFVLSLLIRAAANMVVGSFTAGPSAPDAMVAAQDTVSRLAYGFLLGVFLPAVIETPFVVWAVRRARDDAPSLALAVIIAIISALAWLLHGMSPGSLGQATAFAVMAYAAWAWGRRLGRLRAYALPTLSHAVWNGIGLALFMANPS